MERLRGGGAGRLPEAFSINLLHIAELGFSEIVFENIISEPRLVIVVKKQAVKVSTNEENIYG